MSGTVWDVPNLNSFVVGVEYDEPTKPSATGAVAGTPGTFTPAGAEVPENPSEVSGLTASPATTWLPGQYIVTVDKSEFYWNGTIWAAGRALAEGDVAYDPGEDTVDDVKAYVDANPDQGAAVLQAERDGKNRSTLVGWLEERLG